MENHEKIFKVGYSVGQEALVKKAIDLVGAPKPSIINLAVKKISKTALPIFPWVQGEAGWLQNYTKDPLQRRLFEHSQRFDVACHWNTNIIGGLLDYMKNNLHDSPDHTHEVVASALGSFRLHAEAFSAEAAMLKCGLEFSHRKHEDDLVVEQEVFDLGFANGQMDLLMRCAKEDDYSEEKILSALIPVMADCTIPFALAPAYLTGWEGEFSDDQLELRNFAIDDFSEAMANLINIYLELQVGRETGEMTK